MLNNDLLSYVRVLSKRDTKTLSQKALKTCEEVGELARVILPYDNAFATTYRFVEKNAILEEVADVMLTALSVAYDLDFTDDDIETMMVEKSKKWAKLQSSEIELKYPLPYEIHITVDIGAADITDSSSGGINKSSVDKFINRCTELHVKPILLDLQESGQVGLYDAMTSSKHFGTNRTAVEEAARISTGLQNVGYDVVRIKIETVPWHPAAPQTQGAVMPKNCYFESHIGVTINQSVQSIHILKYTARIMDAHLSSNAFKTYADGTSVMMLTYRSTENFVVFSNHLEKLLTELQNSGFSYEKVITEFSVYDTKISHDVDWLQE